jgi:hypothetical protein
VTQENFLPRTEVADNLRYLIGGVFHALCHAA